MNIVHYEPKGADVGVWPGTSRPSKGKMVGIIPAQVRQPSYSDPIVGASIQREVDSPLSLMAGYILALLAEYIPTQGSGRWNMGLWCRGTEEQRTISTKKEGVNIWQSTDWQTPKRKESISGKVQTGKPQKGRSWYLRGTNGQTPKRKELNFNKSTDGQSQLIRERIDPRIQTARK